MTSPTLLARLAIAGAAIALLSSCASDTDAADAPSAPVSADGSGAAGIVLADPSAGAVAEDTTRRRAPEAVGSVVSVTLKEDSVAVEFAPDAGYEYFDGTTFDIPFSAVVAVDGETPLVLGDLKAGDRINVWTGDCAESFPVQCTVEAVTAG